MRWAPVKAVSAFSISWAVTELNAAQTSDTLHPFSISNPNSYEYMLACKGSITIVSESSGGPCLKLSESLSCDVKSGKWMHASSQFFELVMRTNAFLISSIERNWTAEDFIDMVDSCTCSRTSTWKVTGRLWSSWNRCCLNSGVETNCFRFNFWSLSFPFSNAFIILMASSHTSLAKDARAKIFSLWVRDMSCSDMTTILMPFVYLEHCVASHAHYLRKNILCTCSLPLGTQIINTLKSLPLITKSRERQVSSC